MANHENFLNNFQNHFNARQERILNDDVIGTRRMNYWYEQYFDYSKEDIERILTTGTKDEQILLSRRFYLRGGFYRNIINYYSTLLKYQFVVIPNAGFNQDLSNKALQKRYYNVMRFLSNINLRDLFILWGNRALIDGTYYGIIGKLDKNTFNVISLPGGYCRTRYKDLSNNDIIEFNLTYFDSLVDNEVRKEALSAYPRFITNAYNRYKKGKGEQWVIIPAELGICFVFMDGHPYFLNVIPEILDYNDTVDTEKERDEDEIRKIIVQKIPHLADGILLFEPDEAAAMHQASVNMMKNNKNVSVLTTYADVDAIVSHNAADTATNTLERMLNNIYYNSGTSSEIFAARSNLTLETSLRKDLSMMMTLADKFSRFMTFIINELFGNNSVNFTFKILPISYYNQKEFQEESLQLANSGYSFLLPALAMDIGQEELSNLKGLENDILGLREKLIPLQTSYTQSGTDNEESAGAPEKEPEEMAPKTEENQESIGRQGE